MLVVVDEPELYVIKPDEGVASDYRARLARDRANARRRYVDHLAMRLKDIPSIGDAETRAAAIIDALTVWPSVVDGASCPCSCHPRLPDGDLHDFGRACHCRLSLEERRQHWDEWEAERDEYWASPEGQAATAARQAEEDELEAWLADHPEVEVQSHGGWAPEQWWGTVEGHSFYFRERHDDWRIELDLRGTGRFVQMWTGGDLDDEANLKPNEIEEGEVIAEGTINTDGYGTSPVERARFLVDVIKTHLERQECEVHTSELADLACLFGREPAWCPACGIRLGATAE